MIEVASVVSTDATSLVTIFERLFENEFATLDSIAISARAPRGLDYLDESVLLTRMLSAELAAAPAAGPGAEPDVGPATGPGAEPDVGPAAPRDAAMYRVHEALYAAAPEVECVIGGWSRHLRALQLEGMALPAATSMMRKRGVTDLRDHLVEADALAASSLDATVRAARETTEHNGMKHILLLTGEGTVVAAAPTRIEAMAHWHNVEFAARVECMRVEEADVHGAAAAATERETRT